MSGLKISSRLPECPVSDALGPTVLSRMTSCYHTTLELLRPRKRTLRCRQCHLTLGDDELPDGYCPECFERSGERNYQFDEIEGEGDGAVTYRCEECGVIVRCP